MKTVNYNNIDYFFSENTALIDLLSREDLIDLPLSIWKRILELKKGIAGTYDLYYVLCEKVKHYDKSSNVNSFHFNNQNCWLDKNTRIGLMNLTNCTDNLISVFLNNQFLEISSIRLKSFLQDLEVYASKCYVNTQKHLLNINQLRTVEDLINYDYTIGYPDKIILNE